ncbi:hypothetical protein SAMN05421780_104289 [Flexibacter flexilis DSM 6793]|uniref:Uncharacterized protein n=1 Tax=Flexibacter flexilis DSM 6793 TaxID=927664 RepID=A0A1I1IG97_9BACT|nr:hypothetical protein SAMN05421780_104289 [Flexibacter flexilis DSM 6793]
MQSKGKNFSLDLQKMSQEKAKELAICLVKRGFMVEFVNVN